LNFLQFISISTFIPFLLFLMWFFHILEREDVDMFALWLFLSAPSMRSNLWRLLFSRLVNIRTVERSHLSAINSLHFTSIDCRSLFVNCLQYFVVHFFILWFIKYYVLYCVFQDFHWTSLLIDRNMNLLIFTLLLKR
jgi:hypothetical protein